VKPPIRPGRDATERELDAYVVDLCRRFAWTTYHVSRPERGPAGFPDRVLSRGDVFAIVEEKRSLGPRGGTMSEGTSSRKIGGRWVGTGVAPSEAQIVWLDAAARARWLISAVWRPTDAERIELFLAGEQLEPPGLWSPAVAPVNRIAEILR
jgi:hypothetical protein